MLEKEVADLMKVYLSILHQKIKCLLMFIKLQRRLKRKKSINPYNHIARLENNSIAQLKNLKEIIVQMLLKYYTGKKR